MNKLTYILILLIFITSISVVSANELNTNELGQTAVYVDSNINVSGDGSISNPYKTLTEAVDSDASDIYVYGGNYLTLNNSQIKITKNLTITAMDDDFVINGDYKNYIFYIEEKSNLVLNNVKFINTHHLNVQTYGAIINYGNLTINGGYFENSDAERSGVILNYGDLNINNSAFNSNNANYYGGAITNFGKSIIYNSNFTSNTAKEGSAILNSYDMIIENSNFLENDIKSTKYQSVESLISIYSSYLKQNSVIYINGSGARIKESYINHVDSTDSLIDISYSFINTYRFSESELRIDSNLWCSDENIPVEANDWLVMMLTDESFNTDIPIKTTTNVLVSFKIYNGNSYINLADNINLPKYYVSFEADNGNFNINGDYLKDNQIKATYANNTKNTKVYAKLDEYYAMLVVGTGFNNQEIYVSGKGSDKNGDGSINNPYKTISKAVKCSLNGDIICISSGVYKGSENSNILVEKSLTFKSYNGAVIIYRADSNLFNIEKRGEATIIGLDFRVENYNMYFPIVNNTGSASIINCSFDKINGGDTWKSYKSPIDRLYNSNEAVILSNGNLKVDGCNFTNIENLVIRSLFNVSIDYFKHFDIEISKSIFENCTCIKWDSSWYSGKDSYIDSLDGIFPVFMINVCAEKVIIDKCQFIDNEASIFRVKDFDKFIIRNSIFTNNNGIAYNLGNYSEIVNCTITGETGPEISFATGYTLPFMTNINLIKDSKFYKNNGQIISTYYYQYKMSLYNCSFINNTNSHNGLILNSADMDIDYCTFENNEVFYGGVFYNNQYLSTLDQDEIINNPILNITNSVFYNNSATLGNDIFMHGGTLYTSDCWWGSNQGPNNDNIFVDTGDVNIKNWAILSFDLENGELIAGFNRVTDYNRTISNITGLLPPRLAVFDSDMVEINPKEVLLTNNIAKARIDFTGIDITANVTVDDETIDLVFYNKNTRFDLIDWAFYGMGNKYSFSLKSVNGYELTYQNVTFQISNDTGIMVNESLKTNGKGEASYIVNLSMGNYTVRAFYAGDDYFRPTESTASLEVLPYYTVINMKENQTFYGNGNFLYAYLYDNFGHSVSNQSIVFTIKDDKGKIYKTYSISNGKGQAGIYLNLTEGSYSFNASYAGDGWHYASYSEGLFTIRPVGTNLAIEQSVFNGRGNLLTVVLRDDNYRAIFNETIELSFTKDSVTQVFNITTNEDGRGGITVNLAPGIYTVEATYAGDYLNHESKAVNALVIKKVNTILSGESRFIFDNSTNTYSIKLTDIYGRKLADERVSIEIVNQVTSVRQVFDVKTDSNGVASLKANLDMGSYIARAHFAESVWYGPSEYASTVIVKDYIDGFDAKATILLAEDLTKYYMNESQYVLQLSDIYGKALSSQKINVKIDDLSYQVSTDSNGTAKLDINLKPGVYAANAVFDSSNIYSASYVNSTITVLSRLITNDLTKIYRNESQFIVKVVDGKGNPESNKTLYLTLNNQSYERTTNETGEAKLNINLNPGTYFIMCECDNYTVTNKITVISQLNTRDLEMYYKDGSRFKAKLYDNGGNALVNATVYFIINGVTYQRVTDNNGEAGLAINLPSGAYTIVTKYGDFTNENEILVYNMAVNIEVVTNENDTFIVKVTDANGNAITGYNVTFKVNGASYNCEINQTGYAKLNVKLNNGLYRIVTAFCIENYQDRLLYNTLKVTRI